MTAEPQPLKKKTYLITANKVGDNAFMFYCEDVAAAVEWLKELVKTTANMRRETEEALFNHNLAESFSYQKQAEDLEWCLKKIDEAFEDVVEGGGKG